MCGRYGFSPKDVNDAYERFFLNNPLLTYQPHYNIAPGQFNPVITRHSPNRIGLMYWGLIPYWAPDTKMRFQTLNARVETAATSPAYRKPFRYRRCLVPATQFYEWDKNQHPSQPYCIRLKQADIFAFAGLYDEWKNPKTEKRLFSYTILTCQPNALMAPIHNRMPVILRREDEDTWLNPDIVEPEKLQSLLLPYPAQEMEAYPIATAINNPKNDSREVIKPLSTP